MPSSIQPIISQPSHPSDTTHSFDQSLSIIDQPTDLKPFLADFHLPPANSHKGQNGKLLIIGGSELFHAASKWSLDIAAKFVDMVFYSSVPSNNQLIKEAKHNFWNGIVIPRTQIEDYLTEADTILIGPGMERRTNQPDHFSTPTDYLTPLTAQEWQTDTGRIINYLVAKYPSKKWVIDAGALQMIDPILLKSNFIITPHLEELKKLITKLKIDPVTQNSLLAALTNNPADTESITAALRQLAQQLNLVTILLKGPADYLVADQQLWQIKGGNAGMTKGGTGDVLAGLIAAFYTHNCAATSALLGSYLNKFAGDHLWSEVGPFFNASDLVTTIPQLFWGLIKDNS